MRLVLLSLLLASTMFVAWIAAGAFGPEAAASSLVGDPIVAAAGDIACDPASASFNGGNGTTGSCRQKATSDLLLDPALSAVFLLGDNQYYCGGYQAYLASYDKSWGRVKGITRPAPGNHEYLTSGGTDCTSANANAAGYFRYFGTAAGDPSKGYYSFDIGTWHIVVLNSECTDVGGCSPTSPQGKWLRADLAAHANVCTLAYWHIPLFSSGGRASSRYRSFWDALYSAGAEIVLSGHDHIYERFAPQRPDGTADAAHGIRQFVVGTGGSNHTSLSTAFANSEVRNSTTYGVLRLTLRPTGYDWRFVPEAGKTFTDSGSGACHGSGDTTAPSAPSGLTASAPAPDHVALTWSASSDNVGVTGYRLSRNGSVIAATSGGQTTYDDRSVVAATTYSYTVSAVDAAGNVSGPSNVATVTTPSGSSGGTPPSNGGGTTLTFTPTADAYISADLPSSNFGGATSLQVDNSPVQHFLIKFTVSGVGTRTVTGAKLRLRCVNASATGGDLYRLLDTSWSESSVTWGNAPAAETPKVSALPSVTAGNPYEVDLPFVTGDGTYAIRVASASADGAWYSSKEGSSPPQLVVTVP
jgi:hypothetical protein